MERRKDNVLADGELTGHAHVAHGKDVEVYGDGMRRLLTAPNGATITHEEHHEIAIPAGKYVVSHVQEYNFDDEESKNVAD